MRVAVLTDSRGLKRIERSFPWKRRLRNRSLESPKFVFSLRSEMPTRKRLSFRTIVGRATGLLSIRTSFRHQEFAFVTKSFSAITQMKLRSNRVNYGTISIWQE
jgi:hypothetical protein